MSCVVIRLRIICMFGEMGEGGGVVVWEGKKFNLVKGGGGEDFARV